MTPNTILVVDDDADMRESLREALDGEGYTVRVASNGKEAIDLLLRSKPPRGIILDVAMPVMTGPAFYRAMRAVPTLADIPVVMLTSNPTAAPNGLPVMKKPVTLKQLLAVVDQFLGRPPPFAPTTAP